MIWNTAVPVVALVEADSEEEAVAKLHALISRKGLRTLDDGGDAFESDYQDEEPDFR